MVLNTKNINFAKDERSTKMLFELKGEPEVFEILKEQLAEKGKSAVKLEMAGVGWNGPLYNLKLSDPEENDVYEDIEGVRFIVQRKYARGVGSRMLVKQGRGVVIKKDACGC